MARLCARARCCVWVSVCTLARGSWLGPALGKLILLGAIFMEHWGQWHFMATPSHPLGGMMFQVTLVLIALYLMAKGNHT